MCRTPFKVKWDALGCYISVRCKRCEGCMRVRQYNWVCRAAHEQAFAKRTWFVTYTFRPSERANVQRRASAMEGEHSTTMRLVAAAGEYVSDGVKSLRKRKYAFRYLVVPELHQNGFPHFHGLIHDLRGDLNWDILTDAWAHGWSVCKIVRDANALRYVTKYLSKERLGRVRASLGYGNIGAVIDEARMIQNASPKSAHEPEGRIGIEESKPTC